MFNVNKVLHIPVNDISLWFGTSTSQWWGISGTFSLELVASKSFFSMTDPAGLCELGSWRSTWVRAAQKEPFSSKVSWSMNMQFPKVGWFRLAEQEKHHAAGNWDFSAEQLFRVMLSSLFFFFLKERENKETPVAGQTWLESVTMMFFASSWGLMKILGKKTNGEHRSNRAPSMIPWNESGVLWSTY